MRTTYSYYGLLTVFIAFAAPLPGQAQPLTEAPATEAPVPTPLDIDIQAKKALGDLTARYQGLNSYSDVTLYEDKTAGLKQSVETMWERPDKVRITRQEKSKIWQCVTDGKTVWAMSPEHPGTYSLLDLAKNHLSINPFVKVNLEVGSIGLGHGNTFDGYKCDRSMLNLIGLRILRLQGEARVDDVVCRLVTGKFELVNGDIEIVSYYIGVEDGFLRQITTQNSGRTYIEKHTQIRINPELPPATWQFEPPAGARAIEQESVFAHLNPFSDMPRSPKLGALFPAFEATDLNGNTVSLADYKNKVLLLYFFGVGDTKSDVEAWKNLLVRYQDQGFALVGVSLDLRRLLAQRFVMDYQIPYPILFDGHGWQGALALKCGSLAPNTFFLVGRDGRIVARSNSLALSPFTLNKTTSANITSALERALKTPAIP